MHYILYEALRRLLGAKGLKTLTSKTALCDHSQKLSALMSTLAPSQSSLQSLPDRVCSSGSMQTLLHTSAMRSAVRSLMSLSLSVGKPPLGQVRACSTFRFLPQTYTLRIFCSCHPCLRAMASRNALLCRKKPNSSIGRIH